VDRRTLILVATILGSSLAFLDAFVVALALQRIASGIHLGFSGQQWVVLSYSITLGSLYLIAGAAGDRLGRRRVFLAGVVAFAATSAAAGLAPSAGWLIGARAAQGVAAAFVTTNSLALLRAFYKEESGRAIGLWSAWTAGASIAGPPIGGALAEISWRLIFFINLPLAALCVVCVLAGAREEERPNRARRFDVAGAVLAAASLALLTFGLERLEKHSLADTWWAFAGAAAAFALFLVRETRAAEPLLPLGLFRERLFAAANLQTFLVYGALQSASIYMALYLQFLGLSPKEAGLVFIPTSLALALFSARAGRYADRHGPRVPLTVGPLLLMAGYLLFSRVGSKDDLWTWGIAGLIALSLGLPLIVAPITATALAAAPAELAGIASGVNTTLSRLGGLVAVPVLGLAIAVVFYHYAPDSAKPFALHVHSDAVQTATVRAFRIGMQLAACLAAAGALVAAVALRRQAPAEPAAA
jgi:EmrB/QacA subfamily drug resistance transporter